MGQRLEKFLPFDRVIDLGQFLRQVKIIPADDAFLDEPFARFGPCARVERCSEMIAGWSRGHQPSCRAADSFDER